MNNKLNIEYLAGGDDYFGPNFGGAEVYTLGRTGWAAQCPNAATFFKNLTFTVDIENELMGKILDEGAEGPAAAKEWLKAHPTRSTNGLRASPLSRANRARKPSRQASVSDR